MAQKSLSPNIKLTLKQARKTGYLNLSGRCLESIPNEVWLINNAPVDTSKFVMMDGDSEDKWWEQSDLTKLILCNNNIKEIGDGLAQLKALTLLDIHDNQLIKFPESISFLKHLVFIDISRNKIDSLPDSICNLAVLKTLNASHNNISHLSDLLSNLESLEELQLHNNCIVSLPQNFGDIRNIFKLNLSHNKISEIPPTFHYLKFLKELDLTQNHIRDLNIHDLRNLELLYIRHNDIVELPSFEFCNSLKEIYAGNNCLENLNKNMFRSLSKSLIVLDVRDNKISHIDPEIIQLSELERLDLTNNNLSNIPNELGIHPKLRYLILEGNPMKAIRQDILRRGTSQLLKFLASRVETLPEHLLAKPTIPSEQTIANIMHNASRTKTVDISGRGISIIEDAIWNNLSENQLQSINLSKNKFDSFPNTLLNFKKNLNEINFSHNRLSCLPDIIGEFIALQFLDLGNNQMNILPKSMENLRCLREIRLAYNKFSEIPNFLFNLKALEILDVSNNRLEYINHDGVRKCKMLAVLDLSNNNLSQIPPEIGLASQLRTLSLDGNPFRVPRPAIVAKGTNAILDYLRSRLPENCK